MTCKDCLHYELCSYNTYEQAKYFGKDKEVYITIKNHSVCKFFKPTADVVEVRHGEWEIKSRSYRMIDDYDEEIYVECPFCKRTFYVPYEFDDEKTLAYARENYPYCHCGAKMDGERREG